MIASKIREEARENLTGKWGKGALLILIFVVFNILAALVVGMLAIIPVIGIFIPIAYNIILIPIIYGLLASFMNLKRGEEIDYFDFFSIGFSNFGKVWSVIGYSLLKYLPYIICIIVGYILLAISVGFSATSFLFFTHYTLFTVASFGFLGFLSGILILVSYILLIPKFFSLALVFPILYDNPEMNGKEIVEQSVTQMQGHRWNLFYLYLTFLGWAILSIFTLYIGYFFLIPYMVVSYICFYEALSKHSQTTAETTQTKKIEPQTSKEEPKKEESEPIQEIDTPIQEKEEDNNPIQSDDDKKE